MKLDMSSGWSLQQRWTLGLSLFEKMYFALTDSRVKLIILVITLGVSFFLFMFFRPGQES